MAGEEIQRPEQPFFTETIRSLLNIKDDPQAVEKEIKKRQEVFKQIADNTIKSLKCQVSLNCEQ